MDSDWPQVSPRIAELIRTGAEFILDPPKEWVEQLHEASLSGARMQAVADDPILAEGTRRTNWANTMRWASHNVTNPGQRVPAQLTPEIMVATQHLVRRGLDEASLDAFRTAQNVAWRLWMQICFGLTNDPDDLRELLDITSRSISAFIDDTVTAMSNQMRAEREELARGSGSQRREAVTLVLEGAPIPVARAEALLGYRLAGPHTAVVLWSAAPDAAPSLQEASEALIAAVGAQSRLTIVASTASWWMWLPVPHIGDFDLRSLPDVRVSVGRTGTDIEGFRTSHFEAVTTQRMHAQLGSHRPVVHFDDIRRVSLLTSDDAAATEFVADTLGEFASADAELLTTVQTWINLQCNTSRTAEQLYTHRNTVIRRLARADELLPRPLAQSFVDVAVALEILQWRD